MVRRLTLVAGVLVGLLSLASAATAATAKAAANYVALGDSYASGNGTDVYYGASGSCYRSPAAYAPLIAAKLGYVLSFQACSGATSADVVESQVGALSSSTQLVTVQVGGDDADFTGVMEDCALYYFPCSSAIAKAKTYIGDQLPAGLDTAYTAIRRDAPNAEVIVLGYPHLFTAGGATCGVSLLSRAHELALDSAADLLDSTIATAAAAHGFKFVDPRAAYESHELCSSAPWLNNVTLPIYASFHPTTGGEAEFAALLEGAI